MLAFYRTPYVTYPCLGVEGGCMMKLFGDSIGRYKGTVTNRVEFRVTINLGGSSATFESTEKLDLGYAYV